MNECWDNGINDAYSTRFLSAFSTSLKARIRIERSRVIEKDGERAMRMIVCGHIWENSRMCRTRNSQLTLFAVPSFLWPCLRALRIFQGCNTNFRSRRQLHTAKIDDNYTVEEARDEKSLFSLDSLRRRILSARSDETRHILHAHLARTCRRAELVTSGSVLVKRQHPVSSAFSI